jgi:hypothetical protein
MYQPHLMYLMYQSSNTEAKSKLCTAALGTDVAAAAQLERGQRSLTEHFRTSTVSLGHTGGSLLRPTQLEAADDQPDGVRWSSTLTGTSHEIAMRSLWFGALTCLTVVEPPPPTSRRLRATHCDIELL